MTLSSSTSRISYAGDGASTSFPIPFKFLADADIKAIRSEASGTETTWSLNSDYTLSGAGNPAGGTLAATSAPASGETLTILRDVTINQETDLTEGDPLPAETLETALDKLTMICQQIDEEMTRAVKLVKSSSKTDVDFPEGTANQFIRWNSAATALEAVSVTVVDASALTITAFAETFLDDADGDAVLGTIGGLKDVMTTRGDLAYEGDSGEARLGVGASGAVLSSDGTDPVWVAAASQAEMEAGTETAIRAMSPQRVSQAIAALANDGSWGSTASAATTSGTSVTITGVTALSEIGLYFDGVSMNTDNQELLLQIGDSGGLETSGYSSTIHRYVAGVGLSTDTATTGFQLTTGADYDAADTINGTIRLLKLTGNTWAVSGHLIVTSSNGPLMMPFGEKTLSATLDRVSITTVGGTATFDAGALYLMAR